MPPRNPVKGRLQLNVFGPVRIMANRTLFRRT